MKLDNDFGVLNRSPAELLYVDDEEKVNECTIALFNLVS